MGQKWALLQCWFIWLLSPWWSPVNNDLYHIVAATATVATFLLGVGGAAEHLTDCLSDAVTVNAKDSE